MEAGPIDAEIAARAGAANVVDTGAGRTLVDVALADWAPEVLLTLNPDFAAGVAAMPDWQAVPAVAVGQPADRPPLADARALPRRGRGTSASRRRRSPQQAFYERALETRAGQVSLKVPKLRRQTFETAIIERYRRRESSVEEALIEMYLAAVSVRLSRTSPRRSVARA